MKDTPFSIRHFSIGLTHGLAGVGACLLVIFLFAWMNADRFQARRISDIPFEMLVVVPPPPVTDVEPVHAPHPADETTAENITEKIHPANPEYNHDEESAVKDIPTSDLSEATPHPHHSEHIDQPPQTDSHDPHISTGEYTGKQLYDSDLVEQSEYGPLPKISSMGKRPFDAYKHPFRIPEERKLFSLVIAPVGISKDQTFSLIETLPRNVTLGFSPYIHTYQHLFSAAKQAGKETWLILPLEQHDPLVNDAGPLSLRADFSLEENRKNFEKVMGSAAAYTGLLALHASNTTLSFGSARNHDIIREIEQRGLGFAYTSTLPISEIQASFAHDSILHIPELPDTPFEMLKNQIEDTLKTKESAVIVLRPYPSQIDSIAKWLHTLPSKGFVLAPLSAQIMQLNAQKENH